MALLFKPFEIQFNKYENYDSAVVRVFKIPLGDNKTYRSKLNFLVSHISNDDGIVELKTFLDNQYDEIMAISYVDTMTTEKDIFMILNSDSLLITYTSGEKSKVPNMFVFPLPDSVQVRK